MELTEAAYALDSTTIDLCLSLFPWATFRRAKAAVKLHTLLALRGNFPAVVIVSAERTAPQARSTKHPPLTTFSNSAVSRTHAKASS